MEYLKEYDEIGLLEVRSKELTIPKISSIDDILKSGLSALLGDNLNNDITRSIFDTSSLQRLRQCLNTLQSVKIKDFGKFEELFKKCHKEITEGKRKILTFKNEQDIQSNSFIY